MPAITSGKVLVSGANGFLAMWVVRTLLERGFSVRAAVRTAAKGEHVKKTFAEYGDKLELVTVPDITADGAFDEAVIGVDAIEHTASPFHLAAKDPQEMIDPALKGTTAILKSALKNGANVKRIVVTSSVAAVADPKPEPTTFTEKDWATAAPKEVEEKGKDATARAMYQASKTLAEQAAWKLHADNKPSWDLVTIQPPFIFGPPIHEVTSADALNTSVKAVYDCLVRNAYPESILLTGACWVDVRVVADAHVTSLVKEAAGGERFLVSSGPFVWQQLMDIANSISPPPMPSKTLAKGNPGSADSGVVHPVDFDTTKEKSVLGLKEITLKDSARDMLAYFESRGW